MDRPVTPAIELPQRWPLLVVVSGPSGVGKDTAIQMASDPKSPFFFLVTYTTRNKRDKETDNVDYHFISKERFDEMKQRNEFLENADVYGHQYGNSRNEVRAALAGDRDVIMRVDVQGALAIKRLAPEAVSIMILPPSTEALKERLHNRDSEKGEDFELRLAAAQWEMSQAEEFDYVIVNEDDGLEKTAEQIRTIIRAEKLRVKARHVVV